jgi:hypothetical protein
MRRRGLGVYFCLQELLNTRVFKCYGLARQILPYPQAFVKGFAKNNCNNLAGLLHFI